MVRGEWQEAIKAWNDVAENHEGRTNMGREIRRSSQAGFDLNRPVVFSISCLGAYALSQVPNMPSLTKNLELCRKDCRYIETFGSRSDVARVGRKHIGLTSWQSILM
jgi:hypothetical protein